MPFIPTKSYACTTSSWPLGNAKTCKGEKRVPDAIFGSCQLREKTPTENIGQPGLLEVGLRANDSNLEKTIVTKPQANEAGRIFRQQQRTMINGKRLCIGCKNWKMLALDRRRWLHLLEEARAHPNNMTQSTFPGKIPETRKIVFNFLFVA